VHLFHRGGWGWLYAPVLLALAGLSLRYPPYDVDTEPRHSSLAKPVTTDFSDYIWPTDAGRTITSTFAEYRQSHFHGGIDIGTGSSTGFKVYAARDGYVSRIRVSPTGYGKMLYVRHGDGYSTTYAHLRNFATNIEAHVTGEQKALGHYSVDIECAPEQFPVKKGEIIAYTGETGVGSPHLHFEIRDENLDFINPMLCPDFSRTDRIPPTIRGLAIRPIGAGSVVDGSWKTVFLKVHRQSNGHYTIPHTFHLSGAAGLAIDVRDQANGTRFRQGIHSHELFIDDKPYYSVRLDRAPSRNSHLSGLYYDWELVDAGRGRFQKLFIDSPTELLMYLPGEDSAGILRGSRLSEGIHRYKILSKDHNGNAAELSGAFVLNHPPTCTVSRNGDSIAISFDTRMLPLQAFIYTRSNESNKWTTRKVPVQTDGIVTMRAQGFDVLKIVGESKWGSTSLPVFYFKNKPKSGKGALHIEHEVQGSFVRVQIRSDGAITQQPVLTIDESGRERMIPVEALDIDHYFGTFVPDVNKVGMRRLVARAEVEGNMLTAIDEFDLYPIHAGGSGTIIHDAGNLLISYDSSSVSKTFFLEVEKGVRDDTAVYSLKPEYTVLNQGINVSTRLGTTDDRHGLFLHSRRGWELLASSQMSENGMLSGRVTQSLGDIGLFVDNIPPAISRLNIDTKQRRPTVSFRCSDNFSGVEYDDLILYIDGGIVIPEIDGEHHRVTYRAAEPLDRGSHLLKIRALDELGNVVEIERSFKIR